MYLYPHRDASKAKWHARRGGAYLDFDLDRPNRSAYNRLMREVKTRNQERRDAFAKLVRETREVISREKNSATAVR